MLKALIKKLILEQEEQEQNEEQEIKDLFQRWIDEYKVSYLAYRKNVYAKSWIPTQMLIKELGDFIFISPNFEEWYRNDLFIIIYNRENKSIYCINVQTFALAPTLSSCIIHSFSLSLPLVSHFIYYIAQGWVSKVSVDQFRKVMDVTRSNYAQFEALAKKLSDSNQRNANANV